MNLALITVILVAAAALLGSVRVLRGAHHRALRVVLQIAAAILIYLTLFPPATSERFLAGALVVLTPGATEAQVATAGVGPSVVALPGVDAPRGVERVPDLSTALRRHPDTARLRIVGGGLPARDIDAARGFAIDFDAAPRANGIASIAAPTLVRAGGTFNVRGDVGGANGGRVELHDPSGAVVSRANVGDGGAFALEAIAKSAGNAAFSVHAFDASGAPIDTVEQGVAVTPGDTLHVLVLAGAPDPDLKYLRRWAVDAGVDLASRIVLSDGIALEDGGTALAADALAHTDLVIVDERAWSALDASAKHALINATRAGLGVMLRVTGPVPDAVAQEWNALGFRVRAADVSPSVSLASTAASPSPEVVLSRRAMLVEADDAAPLVRANDGSALALWRGAGAGRIAIWWLADTYRIALAGDGAAFGTLWSRALSTVARARGATRPDVPLDARAGQRSVLCALADAASIEQDDGTPIALAIESVDGRRCAGYWPARAGWQTLVSGGQRISFLVRASNAAPALLAAETAAATQRLVGQHVSGADASTTREIPMPRWPFFVAWLAVVALLWWLERSKTQMEEA